MFAWKPVNLAGFLFFSILFILHSFLLYLIVNNQKQKEMKIANEFVVIDTTQTPIRIVFRKDCPIDVIALAQRVYNNVDRIVYFEDTDTEVRLK